VANVPTVSVSEIPADAVLLDCREHDEWDAGHIDGATHVPMNAIPTRLQFEPGPLTPDATIVVVCKVGSRSALVADWLNRNGYRALNLEGGMYAWAAAGRPMTTDRDAEPFIA
jgi:rhodanese-related sulfurtransferase